MRSAYPFLYIALSFALGILFSHNVTTSFALIVFGSIFLVTLVLIFIHKRYGFSLFILCLFLLLGYFHRQNHTDVFHAVVSEQVLPLRQHISGKLERSFPNAKHEAFIESLILGNRQKLTDEEMNLFIRSGTIHLMAISGLHIGVIYFFIAYLLSLLRLKKKIRFPVALLAVWMYIFISGAAPSALRAGILLSLFVIAYLCEWNYSPLNLLAFSVFLLLCFNSDLLYSISFQLSYAAYTGIVLIMPFIKRWSPRIKNRLLRYISMSVVLSITAQLSTAPFVLYYFRTLPVFSLFANLFAIPLVTIILYLLFVYLLLPIQLSFVLAYPIIGAIEATYFVIRQVGDINVFFTLEHAMPILLVVYLCIFVIVFIYSFQHYQKWLLFVRGAMVLSVVALIDVSVYYQKKNYLLIDNRESGITVYLHTYQQRYLLYENDKKQLLNDEINENYEALLLPNHIQSLDSFIPLLNPITIYKFTYEHYNGESFILVHSELEPERFFGNVRHFPHTICLIEDKSKKNCDKWHRWAKDKSLKLVTSKYNHYNKLLIR